MGNMKKSSVVGLQAAAGMRCGRGRRVEARIGQASSAKSASMSMLALRSPGAVSLRNE